MERMEDRQAAVTIANEIPSSNFVACSDLIEGNPG